MGNCICTGFSINKMCPIHGSPEKVRANEQIRVALTIDKEIQQLKTDIKELTRQRDLYKKSNDFFLMCNNHLPECQFPIEDCPCMDKSHYNGINALKIARQTKKEVSDG